LQFGGASGSGYISQRQSRQALEALQEYGKFERGIFHRERGEGKKNQDGFEALWEWVNKKKLTYPKRRYQEAVILDPSSFNWRETDQEGVKRKLLGVFSERETRLEFFRIEHGATWRVGAEDALRLGFIIKGSGECAGKHIDAWGAFEGGVNDEFKLTADNPCEILAITIPSIAAIQQAQAAE
jgi:hypothetical protein